MKKFFGVILILVAITAYFNIGYYLGAKTVEASIKVAHGKSNKISLGEKFLLGREGEILAGVIFRSNHNGYGYLEQKTLDQGGMKGKGIIIFLYSIFWPIIIFLMIFDDAVLVIIIAFKFIFVGGFARLLLK